MEAWVWGLGSRFCEFKRIVVISEQRSPRDKPKEDNREIVELP